MAVHNHPKWEPSFVGELQQPKYPTITSQEKGASYMESKNVNFLLCPGIIWFVYAHERSCKNSQSKSVGKSIVAGAKPAAKLEEIFHEHAQSKAK